MSSLAVHKIAEMPSAVRLAVRVDNVSKCYKLYDRPFHFLKEALTGSPYHRDKNVLSDISIDIGCGEIVGIIGRNGAGKSTLLKIVAGTLAPTRGTVTVNGRVSAILELGTGFNPNYSGRDNVILSALMRGMSEEAIRSKFESVVSFAGMEDVIDEPFHTYSTGMQARLAFAAAISVEADILIIDEALAAGDMRFASRSLRRVKEICQSGVTALFVSHTPYHVMQLCTRTIWIDDGRIRMDGEPIEVVRAYEYEMHEAIARDQGRMVDEGAKLGNLEPSNEAPERTSMGAVSDKLHDARLTAQSCAVAADLSASRMDALDVDIGEHSGRAETKVAIAQLHGISVSGQTKQCDSAASTRDGLLQADHSAFGEAGTKAHRFTTGQYRILQIAFLDRNESDTRTFRFGESLKLRVHYECLLPELPPYSCGLAVAFNRTSDFEAVMYFNTNYAHSDDELGHYFDVPFRKLISRRGVIEAVIEPIQLRAGEYFVSLGILPNQPGIHEFYEYLHCQHTVTILPNGFDEPAVFYPNVSWSHGPVERE
jgi:ABC-type polysaccharide/polyol phosphate transport system ATPase subunit